MNTIVMKFGGSSFLVPEDYRRIAAHIAERRAQNGAKVVTVVSAMSGMTDNLKDTVLSINDRASDGSLDAALATGEMLSTSLLEAAVSWLGISVTSLNAYSLGLYTDSDFGRASIVAVDSAPIRAALSEHDVVIVAGAQAVDQSGRITMLGRNSSDLTATVVAAMVEVEDCEIYSDVCGVYSADPYIVPGARLIRELGYEALRQMSRYGAKVLHYRAVECAEMNGTRIVCKKLHGSEAEVGTIVSCHGRARAVVVARDAARLHYGHSIDRDRALSKLIERDLNAILLEEKGTADICLVTDVDFALRQLRRSDNMPVAVNRTNLVAELSGPMPNVRVEPEFDSAVAVARSVHSRLYPDAFDAPPPSLKGRSTYSALLTRPAHPHSGRL